jgi:hypothetical protein
MSGLIATRPGPRLRAGGAVAAACVAVPALAAMPTAQSVQSAYDAARVQNAERHAIDLVIQDAQCRAMKTGGYACQIDFVRRAAPDKRLYFDVVTLDEREGQWVLLSGLCVKPSR